MFTLPATGRGPTGLNTLGLLAQVQTLNQIQRVDSVLALPSSTALRYTSYQQLPPSTLPEPPLREPIPYAAENLAAGIGGLASVLGLRQALIVLGAARKATVYSGHPGFDIPFWLAYLRSPGLEDAIHAGSNEVLSINSPTVTPVVQRSLAERLSLGFANQQELDDAFNRGRFGFEDRVRAELADLRRVAAGPPGLSQRFIDPQAAGQLADSIEAGLIVRELATAKQAAAISLVQKLNTLVPMLFQPNDNAQLPALLRGSADP